MSCDIIIIIDGLTAWLGTYTAYAVEISSLKESAQKILNALYPENGLCTLADARAEVLHSKMHNLQDWIGEQPSASFYADLSAFCEDLGKEAENL